MEELAGQDLLIIAGVLVVIIGLYLNKKNKNVKGSSPKPSRPFEPAPPKKRK